MGTGTCFVESMEPRHLLSATWSTDLEDLGSVGGLAADAGGAVYASAATRAPDGTVSAVVWKKDAGGAWSAGPALNGLVAAPGRGAQFPGIGTDAAGNLYAAGQATDADGLLTWVVIKSGDGGATWRVVDRYRYAPGQSAAAAGFAADAAGALYVVGYGKDATSKKNGPSYVEHWLVRRSTDGGATWAVADDYLAAPGLYSRAQDVAAAPGGTLYAAGYSGTYWVTRRSTDGGATWTTVDQYEYQKGAGARANGVGVDDAGNAYVVGSAMQGTGLRSTTQWVVRKLGAGATTWATADRWMLTTNVGPSYGSVAEDVVAGPNGEVDVVGRGMADTTAYSSHFLTRSSADGGRTWATTDELQPNAGYNSQGWAITRDRDGNVLTGGFLGGPDGGHLVVRTDAPPTAPATTSTAASPFSTAAINDPAADQTRLADEILA